MKQHHRDLMIVLFIAGLLLLNYPLLSSVDRLLLPLGIPLLYLYVFLVWLIIIVAMAFIVERAELRKDDRTDP